MADRVWKAIYPYVFGCSKQLWQNKFFDPSTPSMRKMGGKPGEKREKNYENSGHYVIASSRQLKRRPLEHHTLMPPSPICKMQ